MAVVKKLPKLVIIGAGVSGAQAAHKAFKSGAFDVTVIEPKEFVEVPFAAVRAVVDPKTADKSLIPIKDISLGKHITGSAKQIKKASVVLESGEEVAYDYLVVATGAVYSGNSQGVVVSNVPTIVARKQQLQAVSEQIKAAKSIAFVGGGPVSIEILGEVLDKYVGKEITLIHSGATLLEGKDIKMHNYIMAALQRNKVKVLLGDRAEAVDESAHTLTTMSGKTVAAEMVIWGTGSKPNTTALVEGEFAGAVDAKGFAKVDPYLRLQGAENVWVLGDSNDTPGAKLGFLAGLQAALTVANLVKVASGATTAKLSKWAPPMQPKGAMFVTLGKNDGIGHVGGCICTGWAVKRIKGKDLFVGQQRTTLGVPK